MACSAIKDAKRKPADQARAAPETIGQRTQQHQPQAEEAVERADAAQVQRAGLEHLRVVAEQPQPGVREQRGPHADRRGHRKGHRGADGGGTQRALALARADAGANHGHQRRAQAEDQRHHQVLQPRRGAVAGDRRRERPARPRRLLPHAAARRPAHSPSAVYSASATQMNTKPTARGPAKGSP